MKQRGLAAGLVGIGAVSTVAGLAIVFGGWVLVAAGVLLVVLGLVGIDVEATK